MVVDAGWSGTRIRAAGRPVRLVPVGGRDLDAAVRAMLPAPPCREGDVTVLRQALSLRPAATIAVVGGQARVTAAQVRAAIEPRLRELVAAVPPGPVLLVGGLARTPLLAELLAERGPVTVANRPERAARRLDGPPSLGPIPGPAPSPAAPSGPATAPSLATTPDPAPPRGPTHLLPPPPRPSRTPRALLAAGGAVVATGLLAVGLLIPDPLPPDRLVQYGYAVAVPEGWVHAGGEPERRRTLLVPAAAPDGAGLVAVERTPLGYDADVEPARARTDLRARYDAAVADGAALDGFREESGEIRYREGGATEWHVRFTGTEQLSVGCRFPPGGSAEVERACVAVSRSLELR